MTTYYVDGAVGNDGNAGTSEGAGNAWATIDNAMNNVAAGDKVWVKASASYAETVTIDTAGTTALPIVFEGYTSSTGDNGKATIDGTGNTNCMTESITGSYYIFKNFIFANATSRGVQITAGDYHTYLNCEFNNNGSDGILCDNSFTFVCCEFTSNGSRGINAGSSVNALGCIFANNTADAIDADSAVLLYRNVVYGISDFLQAFDTPSTFVCIGNTLDGENTTSSTGVAATADSDSIIVDNIIYDFATGVDIDNTPIYSGLLCAFNLMNSNTTDYDQSGELIGYQDVSSAPGFTDEAGDDYTLGGSSPAIDAGITPGGVT